MALISPVPKKIKPVKLAVTVSTTEAGAIRRAFRKKGFRSDSDALRYAINTAFEPETPVRGRKPGLPKGKSGNPRGRASNTPPPPRTIWQMFNTLPRQPHISVLNTTTGIRAVSPLPPGLQRKKLLPVFRKLKVIAGSEPIATAPVYFLCFSDRHGVDVRRFPLSANMLNLVADALRLNL